MDYITNLSKPRGGSHTEREGIKIDYAFPVLLRPTIGYVSSLNLADQQLGALSGVRCITVPTLFNAFHLIPH